MLAPVVAAAVKEGSSASDLAFEAAAAVVQLVFAMQAYSDWKVRLPSLPSVNVVLPVVVAAAVEDLAAHLAEAAC
jgi:hypothetical protein